MADVSGEHHFFAHSANHGGIFEPMREHIDPVARLAAQYAAVFEATDQARAMGLLHDIGKYAERFQRGLRDHAPAGKHSMAGAILALQCYKQLGCMPAAAILGHHGGLGVLESRWCAWAQSLTGHIQSRPKDVTETDLRLLVQRFREDGLDFPPVAAGLKPGGVSSDDMLDTRILFSALVDADFIETEAHLEGDSDGPRRYRPEGPSLTPQKALAAVEEHVRSLQNKADADPQMHAMRQELHDSCLAAADLPPGLFTLAAPTGSGKTLAMLAFALRHAARHELRRVVLVMPFLNIIDQTAKLYHRLFAPENGFPEDYVLEDHSLAPTRRPSEEEDPLAQESESQRLIRLLAENWDAPIVLTTNVQCLESLMSSRTSACRKLHRLAKSVVMFDEVQTLPRELAVATLAALSRLRARFGASIMFATATQPAFEHLDGHVCRISTAGWRPQDILHASEQGKFFELASRRVCVHWEHDTPVHIEDLADRLADDESDQLMCIVNLKRHAQMLAKLLAENCGITSVRHLSTLMCPLHREAVLDDVKCSLDPDRPKPVRLISTQCVEAGVDIDFPVVYRAMAPLEAIAQAAGRCNRHGARPRPGRVHVFKPLDNEHEPIYPPGYEQAARVTETFVNDCLRRGIPAEDMLHDPGLTSRYFRDLYVLTGTGRDAHQRERDLYKAMRAGNFREVARLYRLIPADTINILVSYKPDLFDRLLQEIRSDEERQSGFIRRWIAVARPLTVSIYRPADDAPIWTYLDPIYFARRQAIHDEPDWYAVLPGLEYDDSMLGLIMPTEHDLTV